MKSIKFASAIALAAGVLVMGSAQAAETGDLIGGGTLSFSGRVEDQTCTIRGGAGTNREQGNISVTLDNVQATELTPTNQTAKHKAFTLIVGGPGQGTCENGKFARLTFLAGRTVDPSTGTLINTAPDGAANTNLQLTKGTAATAIDLNNSTEAVDSDVVITGNTANIGLGVQYYRTGAVTAGAVNSNIEYEVRYN